MKRRPQFPYKKPVIEELPKEIIKPIIRNNCNKVKLIKPVIEVIKEKTFDYDQLKQLDFKVNDNNFIIYKNNKIDLNETQLMVIKPKKEIIIYGIYKKMFNGKLINKL